MIALLGALVAGCIHALEMDHMAAVTTFVSRRPHPLRAFGFGMRWGLGHSLAILVAGGALLTLRVRPPENLVILLEAGVGAMLVGLGVWVLRGALRRGAAGSEQGRSTHPRVHAHEEGSSHAHGTTWVGAAHGLAGTAGFLALVPATTLASPTLAAAYLALFGVGTMLAMGLYAAGAGLVLQRVGASLPGFDRWARFAAGAASMAVGVAWMLRTL